MKLDTSIEWSASIITLAGIWLGSSTFLGALAYLVANLVWAWLIYRRKLWGLAPLTLVSFIMSVIHIVKPVILASCT